MYMSDKDKAEFLLTRQRSKKRRAALRLRRLMLHFRIMSTSAVKRANELLILRHHDGSYKDRRYTPIIRRSQ